MSYESLANPRPWKIFADKLRLLNGRTNLTPEIGDLIKIVQ